MVLLWDAQGCFAVAQYASLCLTAPRKVSDCVKKGETNSMQVASVVKEEEQQQEEREVQEEDEQDKGAQDNVQADLNPHHEDGIATNIKVKEVPSHHVFVHADKLC